jgi:hypothetical protein
MQMPSGWGFSRQLAAVGAFAATLGGLPLADSAAASTPPLVWNGTGKLVILCVLSDFSRQRLDRQASLCQSVRNIAARNAPFPVEVIAAGDPALLAPDAAAVLVHASREREQLAFTLRVYRRSAEADSPLFGSAPRAVPAGDSAALDAALGAALAETLPWLARPEAPRPND